MRRCSSKSGSEELAHNFTAASPCPAFPSIAYYNVQTSWQMGPTAAPCLYPGQLHSWRCSSEGHGQQETSQVFPGLFLCPEHPTYHQKQAWHPGFLVQETMSLLMGEVYKRHGEPAEALQTLHTGYSVDQSWCPPRDRQVVSVTKHSADSNWWLLQQWLRLNNLCLHISSPVPAEIAGSLGHGISFTFYTCRQHCNAYWDLWSIPQQSSKGRLSLNPNLSQNRPL